MTHPILKAAGGLLLAGCFSLIQAQDHLANNLSKIKLPPGFTISVFAENVPGARQMALGKNGTIFVGSRDGGNVYAITVSSGGAKAAEIIRIANGLDEPNGVAFRDGALYVAEIPRVIRFDNIESNLRKPPKPVIVYDKYPKETHHGWKYIAFGPDGYLYVPVGMPCNICLPKKPIFGTITRLKPDGTGFEIYATGIRNTVGFDWHPVRRNELWFTDNGADYMGDNQPPDELNKIVKKGMNFGFPYCHGKSILDPKYGEGRSCKEFTPPEIELGPHVAALGMKFYTGKMFPDEYRNQIFIAEHGSWNRSKPIGYRVTMVTLMDGTAQEYKVFAEGWLDPDGTAWGRPVDVLVMPDGSLLVSDDKAGVIYRISYGRKP